MSRSRKKPIYKDIGFRKRDYWRSVRAVWKQQLNINYMEPDLNFKSPKSIINDYDYYDYISRVYEESENYIKFFGGWTKKDVERYSRK